MVHKKKSKDDKNLVWIEQGDSDKSKLKIALEVLNMYEDDFNLTIAEICSILLCDRQWVVKNVKDNVKHIFLNENYRQFLMLINAEHRDSNVRLVDYYYFSRSDFYSWLEENTVVTRQTIRIDLSEFCEDEKAYKKATDTYHDGLKTAPTIFKIAKLRAKYYEKVYETLNEKGKELFENIVDETKRDAEAVVCDVGFPDNFTSVKVLKSEIGKSLEIVYRKLYLAGAYKYTILDSLVRYDYNNCLNINSGSEYSFMATVPFSAL